MQDYDDISNVMLAPMNGWKLSTPFFASERNLKRLLWKLTNDQRKLSIT